MRLSTPEILVDINRIEGLSGIAVADGMLRIGAMTRHYEVERSPLVAQHAPLIAQAMPHVAHAAIRNRGTFGGSLAFADPAAELPACVVALDARLVLESSRGRRTIPAAEFFQGLYSTALAPDEILIAAEIPLIQPGTRQRFAELARRQGDYALMGLAANITGKAARLVYLCAGDRPVLAQHAAYEFSKGKEAVIKALEQDLHPPEDFNASAAMRLHLARVMTRQLLEELAV
jgi:carbon-monoxide dehydrogenase medium subunit